MLILFLLLVPLPYLITPKLAAVVCATSGDVVMAAEQSTETNNENYVVEHRG